MMGKHWLSRFSMIIAAFLFASAAPLEAARQYTALVIDAKRNKILHSTKPDAIVYPASLTKMMTVYLLFEAIEAKKLNANTRMVVSKHAAKQPPTKLGLKAGKKISVVNAILGILTKSANDASVVVAEKLAGSEAKFAIMMTNKAKQLGMKNTVFKNASGLPHKQQVTTARDMIKLSQAMLKRFPRYYRYFATQKFRYDGRTYRNHNKLLGRVKGVDGLKTGYTNAAGFNLAASAKRGDQRIFAVVTGGKSGNWRDRRMAQLIEDAFERIFLDSIVIPKAKPVFQGWGKKRQPPKSRLFEEVPVPADLPAFRLKGAAVEKQTTKPTYANRSIQKDVGKQDHETKRDKTLASDPISRGWGIQIGIFEKAQEAFDQAQSALDSLSIDTARVSIIETNAVSDRKFKAHLVGLDKWQAVRLCEKLMDYDVRCVAVPVGEKMHAAHY